MALYVLFGWAWVLLGGEAALALSGIAEGGSASVKEDETPPQNIRPPMTIVRREVESHHSTRGGTLISRTSNGWNTMLTVLGVGMSYGVFLRVLGRGVATKRWDNRCY